MVQTCIVHLLRNSTDFLSWKDRKPLVTALKGIYRAVDAKAAEGTTLRTYGPLSRGYRLSSNTGAEASIRLESEGFLPKGASKQHKLKIISEYSASAVVHFGTSDGAPSCGAESTVRVDLATGAGSLSQSNTLPRTRW